MAIALRNSTNTKAGKGKPLSRKKPRPGKNKAGLPFASGIPTAAEIEQNPELLAGTGRGNPGCPTLRVNPRKRPSFVVVKEGENGSVRASVHNIDVTGILRWIGKAGFKWQVAATWLTSIGVPLRRNTIVSQVSAGAGYDPKRWKDKGGTLRGPVPDVPASVQADIRRLSKADPSFEFEG